MTENNTSLEEELLELMAEPLDPRLGNWLRHLGVKDCLVPSPLIALSWLQMSEEEKDKFV